MNIHKKYGIKFYVTRHNVNWNMFIFNNESFIFSELLKFTILLLFGFFNTPTLISLIGM